MNAIAEREAIAQAIRRFRGHDLFENGINLFKKLGYNTDRQNRLSANTYDGFRSDFIEIGERFNEDKAFVREWQRVELLFQLSNEEMQYNQPNFGKLTVDRRVPASYLFFAIELNGKHHPRTHLANVTREINKLFPMHVFVLFKQGNLLTLSLIDRRQNKIDRSKDVMERVTHVYGISVEWPHPGHIQILHSFSLNAIREEAPKGKLQTFADLQYGWRKVLSTSVLNKQFYLDYQALSRKLVQLVFPKHFARKSEAHQGVLNLLNRIMFVYFLQKKKWLMGDENFMIHFWHAYKDKSFEQDKFHRDWLNTLFFAAFNGKAADRPGLSKALPEPYRSALQSFPFLNGGLFYKDEDLDVFHLPDTAFHEIFSFFESYIFTITENTAYDVNLEVSPELLGRMYEGMINARDMNDLDAQKGIVYTEPAEINFMTRRSFVEVLWRKKDLPEFERLKNLSREFLYHFVFDGIEQKKDWLRRAQADAATLRRAICSITACDPACGSGSMLLGVLQLQMELLNALDAFESKRPSHRQDFELKKRLISECLYGVDVKKWAVRIAELRLWLYMIEKAEFSEEELAQAPLLPNLDFKLRCGNSLISKIGEQDFSLKALRSKKNLNSAVVAKLTAFIEKKKQFIVNKAPESTFKKLKGEECEVFKAFIKERIAELERERNSAAKNIVQTAMFEVGEKDLFAASRVTLAKEIETLKALYKDIERRDSLLFNFELDFMEIFLAKDDPGFDLVIGNPPYVRRKEILPPDNGEYLEELLANEDKDEKTRVSKQYVEALNHKVYETYPFLYTKVRTEIEDKTRTVAIYGTRVPGGSDLYVYFQLLCPQYLNANGIFCFIISNSWLDVEYGAFVQHFLLKHTRLLAVYDCNVRSFNASVNTVIYLHGALINIETSRPSSFYKTLEPPEQPVRFVMNKIDYTIAADADWLIEQEQAQHNTFRTNYRIITQSQKTLCHAGYNEETKSYDGDKWGGKYLRAPEIYYAILEKGKDKLVRLGDIAEVRRGFTTGANEFFYLDEEKIAKWAIEKEFLVPILKSPKECKTIEITPKTLKYKLFYCHKDKKDLKGTNALRYIKWGEESELDENAKEFRKFHLRPTCLGRKNWYDVGVRNSARINCNYMIDSLMRFYLGKIFVGDNFQEIHFHNNEIKEVIYSVNSSLFYLFLNVVGRANFGDGLMKLQTFEVADLIMMRPTTFAIPKSKLNILESFVNRTLKNIYQELGFDRNLSIRAQRPNPLPDRKALDDIIFDELGLTSAERNEVYWSVAELVKQRLDKAATR